MAKRKMGKSPSGSGGGAMQMNALSTTLEKEPFVCFGKKERHITRSSHGIRVKEGEGDD
jgi:hypothetical protein